MLEEINVPMTPEASPEARSAMPITSPTGAAIVSPSATISSTNAFVSLNPSSLSIANSSSQKPMFTSAPCRCLVPDDASSSVIGQGNQAALQAIAANSGAELIMMESVPETLADHIVAVVSPSEEIFRMAVHGLVAKLFNHPGVKDPEGRAHFVLVIPQNARGSVIGPKGTKIKEIEEETGAILDLRKDAIDGMTDLPLKIQGDETQVAGAVGMVHAVITDMWNNGKLKSPDFVWEKRIGGVGAVSNWVIDPMQRVNTKAIFVVDQNMAGFLVGKNGRHISELQEQSGARLNLVREIYEPCGPDDRIVEISGAFQAKMNGIETLLNAMSNKPPPEGEQWTPAARNAAWKMDTWMMVPEGSVKFLIGKGGVNIKDLRAQSGCLIEFDKNETGRYRMIKIQGSLDRRTRAAKMIFKHIEEIKMTEEGIPKTLKSDKPVLDRTDAVNTVSTQKSSGTLNKYNNEQMFMSSIGGSDASVKLTLLLPRQFVANCVNTGVFDRISKKTSSTIRVPPSPSGFPSNEILVELHGPIVANSLTCLNIQEELVKVHRSF